MFAYLESNYRDKYNYESSFFGAQTSVILSRVKFIKLAWNMGGWLFSTGNLQYFWNGATGKICITDRKLHTRFRFTPKSTTLDALEQPLRTLVHNICVFQHFQSPLRKYQSIPWELGHRAVFTAQLSCDIAVKCSVLFSVLCVIYLRHFVLCVIHASA